MDVGRVDICGIGGTCVAALVVFIPLMPYGEGLDSVPADLSPVILQVCNTRIVKAAPLFALILAGLRGVLDRILDAGFTGDYVKYATLFAN